MTDFAALLESLVARDAFVRHLGIELVEGGPGHATVRIAIRPEFVNFNGTCHGGVLFSLADTAFGLAANSHGEIAIGIDTHMTFAAPARPGETITASAREQTRGRRVATYRIDLTRENGRVIAGLTGTVFRTGEAQGENDPAVPQETVPVSPEG